MTGDTAYINLNSPNTNYSLGSSPGEGSPRDLIAAKSAHTERKVLGCGTFAYLVGFLSGIVSALLWSKLASVWQTNLWVPDFRHEYDVEPLGKKTIRHFDGYLIARGGRDGKNAFDDNVQQFLAPDFVYESVGFGTTHSAMGWANSGEEHGFRTAFPKDLVTQMLFFGDNETATTTSYLTLYWGGELLHVPPPNVWITLRVTDFYNVEEVAPGKGMIKYNFMMIDWADVLHQAGRPMLPPAPLPEGLVLPPQANDGVPAPFSVLASTRNSENAHAVAEAILADDWLGNSSENRWWHQDLTFYGPRGIGLAQGVGEFREHVLLPFRAAFSQRTLTKQITSCEGNYCAVLGRLSGHHTGSWLGLPVSSKVLSVRFGMHWRIVDGKAKEGWAIFDVPGLYQQLGMDFFALAANHSPMSS